MKKGYFQIYTGDGKGKTTAALGLALRGVGAGMRIYIGQFVKSMEYHEISVIKERIPEITVELYGIDGCIAGREPSQRDILSAKNGLKRAVEVLRSKEYDLVILDEVTICGFFKLLSKEEILSIVESRPQCSELIMTGRYAPDYLIEKADLVSEMKEIKHYYAKGVDASDGIER